MGGGDGGEREEVFAPRVQICHELAIIALRSPPPPGGILAAAGPAHVEQCAQRPALLLAPNCIFIYLLLLNIQFGANIQFSNTHLATQ